MKKKKRTHKRICGRCNLEYETSEKYSRFCNLCNKLKKIDVTKEILKQWYRENKGGILDLEMFYDLTKRLQ